jgi:hypothetical protein
LAPVGSLRLIVEKEAMVIRRGYFVAVPYLQRLQAAMGAASGVPRREYPLAAMEVAAEVVPPEKRLHQAVMAARMAVMGELKI